MSLRHSLTCFSHVRLGMRGSVGSGSSRTSCRGTCILSHVWYSCERLHAVTAASLFCCFLCQLFSPSCGMVRKKQLMQPVRISVYPCRRSSEVNAGGDAYAGDEPCCRSPENLARDGSSPCAQKPSRDKPPLLRDSLRSPMLFQPKCLQLDYSSLASLRKPSGASKRGMHRTA